MRKNKYRSLNDQWWDARRMMKGVCVWAKICPTELCMGEPTHISVITQELWEELQATVDRLKSEYDFYSGWEEGTIMDNPVDEHEPPEITVWRWEVMESAPWLRKVMEEWGCAYPQKAMEFLHVVVPLDWAMKAGVVWKDKDTGEILIPVDGFNDVRAKVVDVIHADDKPEPEPGDEP